MNNYPEVVAKIADDYLERVKSQLRLVPAHEQAEFLREIESHLYEAYQRTPSEDDVARILAVLRNFGEPAEVVSDRLPGAMVRSGTKRNLPLYILGGILIALFGLPLGAAGMGVAVGLLGGLVGVLVAYYSVAGSFLLVGALTMLLGLTRILLPQLFDRLVVLGYVQMNGPVGEFFDNFPPFYQGLLMILFASVFAAGGLGMLWLGKYLLRGLRFLFSLSFDWMRRFAQGLRRKPRQEYRETPQLSKTSFAKQ
ncbi:MAG: HAAS signaling domain-containing protein [Bryobacteraceae bacterium]